MTDFLSTSQVAELLGISRIAVFKKIKSGQNQKDQQAKPFFPFYFNFHKFVYFENLSVDMTLSNPIFSGLSLYSLSYNPFPSLFKVSILEDKIIKSPLFEKINKSMVADVD